MESRKYCDISGANSGSCADFFFPTNPPQGVPSGTEKAWAGTIVPYMGVVSRVGVVSLIYGRGVPYMGVVSRREGGGEKKRTNAWAVHTHTHTHIHTHTHTHTHTYTEWSTNARAQCYNTSLTCAQNHAGLRYASVATLSVGLFCHITGLVCHMGRSLLTRICMPQVCQCAANLFVCVVGLFSLYFVGLFSLYFRVCVCVFICICFCICYMYMYMYMHM